ncbi:MAG: PIN domain-containing protein, partial [Crocosphaera sp.]
SLTLPDRDDRHVLAAAIKGQVDVIVTFNLKDFPKNVLDNYEIFAEHPDEFISNLIDLKPLKVARAAENCRKRLKNPSKSIDEYLDILLKQQLPITVSMLRELCYEV